MCIDVTDIHGACHRQGVQDHAMSSIDVCDVYNTSM